MWRGRGTTSSVIHAAGAPSPGARAPVTMARAMKFAVESGRLAYLAGRMGKRRYADPSSPLAGLI